MKHLPLFFDLSGRRVVVVGAGAMADRKAALARAAGAEVHRFEAIRRGDLQGAAVVFVATGGEAGDTAAARAAREARVPVNVADRPALSDFIMPAIVDRDEVVVAVSTGGASPMLATWLRGRVEALLPERIGALARLARTFRAQARAMIADPAARRVFWRRLVEGPAGARALAGDEAGARRAVLAELNDSRRGLKPLGVVHEILAPADPDLLTLRAARVLQDADAVLHDETVSAAVLARARRDAEFVALAGEDSAEVARRVSAGQTVVRLRAAFPRLAEAS
ncbi:MAG: siroheme synthase [Enhydrobacter sp.]|nr:MAG: siroheme synthase [Enhydrobacter sp.]